MGSRSQPPSRRTTPLVTDSTDNIIPFPGKDQGDSLLDALLVDAVESQNPPARPPLSGARVPKLNYSHEAMADLIIANPGISQNEIAQRFGYTASWVSTIMSGDAFQAYYHSRIEKLVDPALRINIETQFKSMVLRSMEILMEKLDGPAKDIPPQLALRALEVSSRCAGYGARVETPAKPQEVHNHLTILSGNLVNLLHKEKRAAGIPIEGDSHEVLSPV